MADGSGVNVKVLDAADGEIEYGTWESERDELATLKAGLREWGREIFF